jgi:hypothetical protein
MSQLTDRMFRAAKLDVALYEEVEADSTAFSQAMLVVVISSAAAGLGAIGRIGVSGVIIGTVAALLGWYVWAFLTFVIGTKLLPEPQTKADVGQLLRVIGFSSAPGVIRVLGIIPVISGLVNLVAAVWMLVAMVIAVRQALDYTTTIRAVGVCLIGWVIQMLVLGLFFSLMIGSAGSVN